MQAAQAQLATDLEQLIKDAVHGSGSELKVEREKLAAYIAERTAHVALLVGKQGYAEALIAERDNIALFAGISADSYARRLDKQLLGIIQTALLIGSRAMLGLA